MQTVLLLVAFQSTYFKKKGNHRVKGAKQSAKSAAKLLAYFRENGLPVIHVLQTGKMEDITADKLIPYELLEPHQDEATLVTSEVNAFADQKLNEMLQGLQADHLLIAGLTAEKQILATAQAAQGLNYNCTVVQDACAASTLKLDGEKLKAEVVLKVAMAMLRNTDVEISTTKAFIKAEQKKRKKQSKAAAKQEAILEATKVALEADAAPATSTQKGKRKNGAAKSAGSSRKSAKKSAKIKEITPEQTADQVNA
ncbi:isochorismatase family protein [Cesiribacter sp. SM1]|uniref:isochorismatase family protein n=1 Tax=Cesiribacter sp. SM1 TaxID=2861196 RepID=UPI001CD5D573|nr:isochorismatase family protein [Cesiribacter sp. SM1]